MCSCPQCGRAKIKRKRGVRQCTRCGILPDFTLPAAQEAATRPSHDPDGPTAKHLKTAPHGVRFCV